MTVPIFIFKLEFELDAAECIATGMGGTTNDDVDAETEGARD